MGEPEERVSTAEVGILTLINKKLKVLVELEQKQIPAGQPVQFLDTEVTGTTLIDFIKDRPYRPLFNVSVYNAGPNNVYVKVNGSEEIGVKQYSTIPFDYKQAAIEKVQLRVNSGESAIVDITGLY